MNHLLMGKVYEPRPHYFVEERKITHEDGNQPVGKKSCYHDFPSFIEGICSFADSNPRLFEETIEGVHNEWSFTYSSSLSSEEIDAIKRLRELILTHVKPQGLVEKVLAKVN